MDAMVGVEYYDSYKKGFSASGYGSPLSDFQDLNYTSTAAGVRQIDSGITDSVFFHSLAE